MSLAFFNALFPSETGEDGQDLGYVVLALYPGGRFDPSPAAGPTEEFYFSWPSQRENILTFVLNNSENDVYTSAALFRTRGSRKGNIARQWAAIADADTLDLRKVRAQPTMTVETSPGRHHLYWVTSTDDVERLTEISRAVADAHKDDGCDAGGWDAGQLLRVPGTRNNKPMAFEHEVVIKGRVNEPYDIDRLEDKYPRTRSRVLTLDDDIPMPPREEWSTENQEVIASAQEIFRIVPEVLDLFSRKMAPDQDRSGTMWRLLCTLSRVDADRTTAMYIAWHAPCNKYFLDNRTPEELWRELCKAYADPANQPVSNSLAALEAADLAMDIEAQLAIRDSPVNPANRIKQFTDQLEILTDDERLRVPTDTFVDKYVAWASTKTDSPQCYHRAGAVTILTSIFGEFGTCPTDHEVNLTLWVLLLGPTTRARKSTSMNLWVDIVSDMQDEMHPYLVGSDATTEGLVLELMKRDGHSSVFFRDEVHGFLYEQEKKRHFAGIMELMTDLYGGRVRPRLRASAVQSEGEDAKLKKNVRTNFVMFLAGTLEQVTKALTIEDYQSGHLARFLVAEADPPPLTREDVRMKQFTGGRQQSEDIHRMALINELTQYRDYWEARVRPRRNEMIFFDDDAWERLDDARWSLIEAAKEHEMAEVLLPTSDRMGISMMKCAILIAMAEGKDKVTMRHLLKAMELAEEWYRATAKIAERIMHSKWSAQQEEILAVISSRTDGVTQYEIYSRFRAKLQERDIDSALSVLTKANQIRRIDEKGGRVRYIRLIRL